MLVATVYEFEHALLYRKGRFERLLPPGTYRFWGKARVVTLSKAPLSVSILTSDIPTQDGAAMRVACWVDAEVTDPVKLVSRYGPESHVLSHVIQTRIMVAVDGRLRAWFAERKFEDVIGKSSEEVLQVLFEAASEPLASDGVKVTKVTLSQYGPTGPIKTAYAELLKADLDAQAALTRARSEAATMRSLLNTARLVREHPGLMELRILTSGAKPRVTFNISSTPEAPDAPPSGERAEGARGRAGVRRREDGSEEQETQAE
jgi:regulator of protease activity HflC (stomatin/prohibitin superfamily)